MILELVIEAGNPRLLPMLARHVAFYGQTPRHAAADGGFATRDNLAAANTFGVCDMAFHKKAGLRIKDMVRSKCVYRKLRNFRAGIEAGISSLTGTMPIIAMEPGRQFGGTVARRRVCDGIGPIVQGGLDEALGLAVGFGSTRRSLRGGRIRRAGSTVTQPCGE
jgi:IS5 family transposase